jgi:hypothetical protein
MANPYGITLDDGSHRWAAAEGVPETVIAAICLLHDERSVHEIVARLTPAELDQVIKIVGRSPRGYPPGRTRPSRKSDTGAHRSRWPKSSLQR